VTETPFFFTRGPARLFGFLHAPTGGSASGFVLSHPFAEEKLWSHRVFVSVARALAERGHAVLRFDYMGAGDSSGLTPETSLDTHLQDLRTAIGEFSRRMPQLTSIGLAGLRLGASFAALTAEAAVDDEALALVRGAPLILWDPVLDGESYFQELLRSNLSTQLAVYGKVVENREALTARILAGDAVNVDGYDIGKALLESCGVPALLDSQPKRHQGPALVMQIAASKAQKDRDDLAALAASYARGCVQRAAEQPFWREIKPFYPRAEQLQAQTLQWLEQQTVAAYRSPPHA
jgi:hypothetical protein